MSGYLLRRSLQALVTVFLVTLLTFGLTHLLPGSPVYDLLGPHDRDPQAVAQLTRQMGLDRPLPEQYLVWLGHLLQGNLGYDYFREQTVAALLLGTLGQTAYIISLSIVTSLLIAIPLGVMQAARRNGLTDQLVSVTALVAFGMPTFFMAFLIEQVFRDNLHLVPTEPQVASFHDALVTPAAIVLPVATLVIRHVAVYSRFMRSAMLDQITQDYVRTAIAKGVRPYQALYRHALRNALVPMITIIGLSLPALVSGALVVEYVFNIQGIGLLTTQAALSDDYSITLAATLITSVMTVLGSLLADLCYAVLDPRVRLDG